MFKFTLSQFLGAIVGVSIVLALLMSDGCTRRYTKIHSLAFSPDGKTLAVVRLNCKDANVAMKAYRADLARTISLVDVDSATVTKVIQRDFSPGGGPASNYWEWGRQSLGFSADGAFLFIMEFGGGRIQRFDLKTGHLDIFYDPGPRQHDLFALAQDRLAFSVQRIPLGMVLLDATSVKPIFTDNNFATFNLIWPRMALSSGHCWLAILDHDQVRVYDANAKMTLFASFPCQEAFALGPQADELAIADGNGLSIRNLATGDVRQFKFPEEIRDVQFASNDKLVTVLEKEIVVLDAETGQQQMRLVHPDWVTALAVSPAGDLAVMGDNRGTIVLWDLVTGNSRTLDVPDAIGYHWILPPLLLLILLFICMRVFRIPLIRKRVVAKDVLSSP